MVLLKRQTHHNELRTLNTSLCFTQSVRTAVLLILSFGLLVGEVKSALVAYNEVDASKDEVLHRLLKVFGMVHPGKREHHHLPPQYMLDLYNEIADSSGITRTPQPYKANIVRSFSDKAIGQQQRFFFNVTASIPLQERVLQAEFHLYKTKARTRLEDRFPDAKSHLLEVRIYQVLHMNATFAEDGNRLLDIRKISTHGSGWEVFYVKDAVADWIQKPEENYGLLVTVRNMIGKPTDFRLTRFAKRHHHQINKQPILVIFTDDGRQRKSVPARETDAKSSPVKNGLQEDSSDLSSLVNGTQVRTEESTPVASPEFSRSRSERATLDSHETPSDSGCTRHELHVDFEKIGWSSWIISPKWYNAYFCRGECDFPLGQNQWPTNHATVQSIVHELKLHPGLGTPCCVPSKLYSINLLYFDEHENVILKQYDDMVAASCGCH